MFEASMQRRQKKADAPPSLNLNSMMDMLSIILVFLLANSSAEEQDFVIAKNLDLPKSSSSLGFTKAVQIKLSKKELLIEDTFVAKVSNEKIVGVEMDGDKIVPLYNMLQRYRNLSKDADKTTVVFQAHKYFPFRILNKVMRTAAMAGYPNFRFAIQKK
jgi:biopolymer transport protein ExbD